MDKSFNLNVKAPDHLRRPLVCLGMRHIICHILYIILLLGVRQLLNKTLLQKFEFQAIRDSRIPDFGNWIKIFTSPESAKWIKSVPVFWKEKRVHTKIYTDFNPRIQPGHPDIVIVEVLRKWFRVLWIEQWNERPVLDLGAIWIARDEFIHYDIIIVFVWILKSSVNFSCSVFTLNRKI